MIVQFFNRGKGGGSGPIEYLLGRRRDRKKAELLRGNPDETAAIIDGSQYAKKYTSGCLSFAESDISPELKIALMDGFEECIFAGLDRDQYNCLWVEHRDKGRLELNFVIPNVELTSGKRLQPYYHAADNKRVDAWRTIQNIEHGFADPDDPERRQNLTLTKDLPRSSQEAQECITNALLDLTYAGVIQDRSDVLKTLENAGFEIARITANSISIKNTEAGKQNIRLKGRLYEQEFRFSEELLRENTERNRDNQRAIQQANNKRLEEARANYQRGITAKRAENNRRHSRPAATNEPLNIQALSVELEHIICHPSVGIVGRERIHSEPSKQQMGGLSGSEAARRENSRSEQPNANHDLQTRWQGLRMRSGLSEFPTMGQERRISRDNATSSNEVGEDYDRDRNSVIERVRAISEQSDRNRRKNYGDLEDISRRFNRSLRRERETQSRATNIKRAASRTERSITGIKHSIGNIKLYFEPALNVINAIKRKRQAERKKEIEQKREQKGWDIRF